MIEDKGLSSNLKYKRLIAYIIDIIIVVVLITLVSNINAINPFRSKATEIYNKLSEYYQSSLSNTTAELVIDKEYYQLLYGYQKYSYIYTIAESLIIILYFTLFPIFNHNQTIGKRIMKIEISNDDNSPVKWWQHLVRSLMIPIWTSMIMYTSMQGFVEVASLMIKSPEYYAYVTVGIALIFNLYCYADIIVMLVRKDNRSLHDLICKTKVISK